MWPPMGLRTSRLFSTEPQPRATPASLKYTDWAVPQEDVNQTALVRSDIKWYLILVFTKLQMKHFNVIVVLTFQINCFTGCWQGDLDFCYFEKTSMKHQTLQIRPRLRLRHLKVKTKNPSWICWVPLYRKKPLNSHSTQKHFLEEPTA